MDANNFAKNAIPVIFYFDGIPEDYHNPTNILDKIVDELQKNAPNCFSNFMGIGE